MKRMIAILSAAILLLLPLHAVCAQTVAETIPLQMTFPSIGIGQAYALPNGSYLVEYYKPDTSEFWLNMGRDDVYQHVIEVFDASGASVWNHYEFSDMLPEDADGYLFQYAICSDRVTYEYYWNHSMERYYLNTWGFDGSRIENPKDAIHQSEEDARYVVSQYPYLLEMWPFGEGYAHPARLTYVIDGSSTDLPYAYGGRTTCVSGDQYCMLYREDDTVRLLVYDPVTRALRNDPTTLTEESGHLVVAGGIAYFLTTEYQDDGSLCRLFSAPLSQSENGIEFQLTSQFRLEPNAAVDALIESSGELYFVVSSGTTSLCTLADDRLTQICAWPAEARYLAADTESIKLIMPNELGDGYQIVTFPVPGSAKAPTQLLETYAANGSQRISFLYPEHYEIEVDDYLGTVVFFNSMDQISVTIPRRCPSAVERLHENMGESGEYFALAEDLELNALHGDRMFGVNLDNVEIAVDLPDGTGVILNVSSLYGDTEVYELLLTIFGSIADETHTALLEEWLRDTWIPYLGS